MSYESTPVLEFDTDHPEFARGFEAGRLYEALRTNDAEALTGQPFHATNAEMVLRMCDALGHDLRASFTEDPTWMLLEHPAREAETDA